jgi:hypothetical protein
MQHCPDPLACVACCRYIFGLPLWQKNAVALSKEIMALAEKNLAPGAVIGYELGNEVRLLLLRLQCAFELVDAYERLGIDPDGDGHSSVEVFSGPYVTQ